ncbi:MAG: hypothetical protein ACXW2E_01870 [Nitrososphaeraceae archaeon]
MDENIRQQFFKDTDHTGRHVVVSIRTGKKYYIEPIGDPHVKWGSIDPATKTLVNKKGAGKYRGSIDEKDSLITEENGFQNIVILEPGISPAAYIEQIDAQYPTIDRY